MGFRITKLETKLGTFAAPNVAMTSVSVSDDAGDDCRLPPFMQVRPPHGGHNIALAALEPLEEDEWYRQMASLCLAVAWCKVVNLKARKAKLLETDLREMLEFHVKGIPADQWPHCAKTTATIERLLAVFKRRSRANQGDVSYIDLVERVKRDREFIRDYMSPWLTKTYPNGLKSGTNYEDLIRILSADMWKIDVQTRERQAAQQKERPAGESEASDSQAVTAGDEKPTGWMHLLTATFLCVVLRSIQHLMLMQPLLSQISELRKEELEEGMQAVAGLSANRNYQAPRPPVGGNFH